MADRLSQLTKLHEADAGDPFLTYGIALEHAKAGRTDESLAWLDRTLALDPNYCYAYFQKAKALLETGDEATARQTLEQGLAAADRAGDSHARSELLALLESISA